MAIVELCPCQKQSVALTTFPTTKSHGFSNSENGP